MSRISRHVRGDWPDQNGATDLALVHRAGDQPLKYRADSAKLFDGLMGDVRDGV